MKHHTSDRRRPRLLRLVSFAFLLGLCASPQRTTLAADSPQRQRPNILFAFADDWGRYASAYGKLQPGGPNDIVHTPNFDRVASEGVLFTNAFVNAPSCTPCRSSLLSGQHFFRTGRGAILQGAIWDETIPTYPLKLREAGYHIGHTYKVWSPGKPRDAPHGGDATRYNQSGRKFCRFSQNVSLAKNDNEIEAKKQILLQEVRDNFRGFLKDRKDGDPFCYWFGPTNCHRKWTVGSGKRLWNLNPDDLKGKLPKFLPDVPVVREDFADYLGEVQAFDAGLGVLLAELERIGELDNTLIAVSGDHGIPGFPNGKCNLYDFGTAVPLAVRWPSRIKAKRVVDDFVSLPDLAPTFLTAANIEAPATMIANDLMPILESTANGQIDPKRDHVITGRERHVASARTDELPYPQRAIRTKDYLYIYNFEPDRWPMGTAAGYGEPDGDLPDYKTLETKTFDAFGDLDASPTKAWVATNKSAPEGEYFFQVAFGRRPQEELFKISDDPDQVTNLAADPTHAEAKAALKKRLFEQLKQSGDPRVMGDGKTFERPPFVGDDARHF